MKVIFYDNLGREKWDEFVKNNSLDFGLLQSFFWGEFQEKLGRQVFRLAVVETNGKNVETHCYVSQTGNRDAFNASLQYDDKILAVAQIIKMPLKFGKSYFYIPRGPVFSSSLRGASGATKQSHFENTGLLRSTRNDGAEDNLLSEIKILAKKENAIFLRLDPPWQQQDELKKIGFKFVGQVQPKQTLILDLNKSEAEILSQLKSKTRYNIKVAEKHQIEIAEGAEYFEDFWRLMNKTADRQEIKPHSKKYYQKMLEILGEKGTIKLIVAKDQKKVICANLVVWFGDYAVYLHGASDYDYRDKMAPYLLQWETIRMAKQAGKHYYDFWGVDEQKWPGVTRFKIGFAPKQAFTEYIGAWDMIYSRMWYEAYGLFKK